MHHHSRIPVRRLSLVVLLTLLVVASPSSPRAFHQPIAAARGRSSSGSPFSSTTVTSTSPAQSVSVYLPFVRSQFVPRTPNPLTVRDTFDAVHQQSHSIGQAGGSITTTGADGTQFTLSIPANALFATTAITLTPISAVDGLPSQITFVAGAHFEPEGLELYSVATLTVIPPRAVAPDHQVFLGSVHQGVQTHLTPPLMNTAQIVFQVTHFSEQYLGDGIAIPVMDSYPPQLTADQIQQELSAYLQQERAKAILGLPGDPAFTETLTTYMEQYYLVAIEPQLQQATQDCTTARDIIPQALSWERTGQLLGLGSAFTAEYDTIQGAWKAADQNCWNQTTQPCLNRTNPQQMAEAQALVAEGGLVGLTFDINSAPQCSCDVSTFTKGWQGTATVIWDQAEQRTYASGFTQQATVSRHYNVAVQLDRSLSGDPTLGGYIWSNQFNVGGTGTAQVNDRSVETSGTGTDTSTTTGGPFVVGAPRGTLTFSANTQLCTYDLSILLNITATENPPNGSCCSDSMNLYKVPMQWVPSTTDHTLRGSQSMAVTNNFRQNGFAESPDWAVGVISQIRGSQYLGNAQLTWEFKPITP